MTTAQFNPSGLPLSKPTGVLPSPAKVGTPPIPVNEHKENQQAKETAPPKEVAPTPAPKPAPANTTTPPPAKPTKEQEPVVLRVILSQEQVEAQLVSLITRFQETVHINALEKGFWDSANQGEKIALIHSELSEALESIRAGEPKDDKVPEFTQTETELADALIRIFDFGHFYKLRLAEAMLAKHKYNLTRPHKHGKNF